MAAHGEAKGNDGGPVTSNEVANWVSDRVKTGRFVPGQRLIEGDIMRATGASRSRVREALQRLEVERLIVIEEFRGASVRTFSDAEMRQLYRVRMALEGLAAHDFADADEPSLKAELQALQDQLDACERASNRAGFSAINDAWHDLIIAGSRNDYIATFVQRLRVPSYRLLFATFHKWDRIEQANADHRAITAAITSGRAEEAERLMRAHIGDALVAIVEEVRLAD
ncbi:hypothetical protein ASG11_05040 [Sphingomonas sp. Leaf357]|uniref:GntR family transcriptional regulator n=1 Tax=Sphingomonas sp. Leaf357 TaxID=1736350 RepID=UPI0006FD4FDF|nr:GntR family transcriptional regulator [Sphingomonas sp. Leaf357]KQS03689.1 hypothetical protein ASG11_05040 [Sphingomonas sp. Leaf357]